MHCCLSRTYVSDSCVLDTTGIQHTVAVRGGYVLENPRERQNQMREFITLREKWVYMNQRHTKHDT
jgi:hypothetical protein